MDKRELWLTGLSLIGMFLLGLPVLAATITVTTTEDEFYSDGDCSLREAIHAANTDTAVDNCAAGSGADTIVLQSGATYTLALDTDGAGHESDSGANNDDLDITSQITIQGNGATIERSSTLACNLDRGAETGEFRIFDVAMGSKLTLQNVTVSNGCADGASPPHFNGGGIWNEGTLEVTNSTISGNSASSDGGGILNFFGMVTITNSTISGNASNSGGGIWNEGILEVTNSTISGNSASSDGGGILCSGIATSLVMITNSTISGNSAGIDGGGIFNFELSTVDITNSTISGNSAVFDGGGIWNYSSFGVSIKNSIVANSPSGKDCATDATFNAFGVNYATDESCPGFTQTSVLALNLGPLANNGGPTQTHALLPGSVAIDAATDCTLLHGTTPVTEDQRGVSRPQPSGGTCDVGAYEARFFTLTVTGADTGSGTVTDTGINCTITAGSTSGDCSESYTEGTDVTLTATPALGSTFAGWSGDPDCTDGAVTMGADKTCTATFNLLFTMGDVNGDGKINTLDARMAQQHADGVITLTGNQFLAADVDQDSDVDSADATGIAKKGIGLPTGIPGFARGPHPRPLSVYGEGWPQAGVRWLFLAFTLPALALLRRHKRLAMLLLVGGLSVLTGCVEFAGLAPPSGTAIYLTSTSMPNGATRTIDLVVQQITAGGGLASLQGRITLPAGVTIQSVTGLNGFVVKASCGTVGDPCPDPNELRLSLVKPSAGGVSNGAVLRLAVQASGAPGQVYTLSWSGNAQAPIVLGSDANVEITGFTTGNGQVKVQ
jgi:CSLREA domain-containing protein